MIQSRVSWLAGLLVCSALIGGCGSSSTSSSSQTSSSTATTAPPASTSTSAPSTSTAKGSSTSSSSIQAAIATCKQQIAAQSSLPAGAKSKLEAVCGAAARGDTAAIKRAAREVCAEVIEKSAIPAGADRERALAACKSK